MMDCELVVAAQVAGVEPLDLDRVVARLEPLDVPLDRPRRSPRVVAALEDQDGPRTSST